MIQDELNKITENLTVFHPLVSLFVTLPQISVFLNHTQTGFTHLLSCLFYFYIKVTL